MVNYIYIINTTDHDMVLKTHFHAHKWCINPRKAFSWNLPHDIDHETKYKIKKNKHTIAYFWINHTGHISLIQNLNKHFSVLLKDVYSDHRSLPEPQTIIILEIPKKFCNRLHHSVDQKPIVAHKYLPRVHYDHNRHLHLHHTHAHVHHHHGHKISVHD
jgi:hypothetical protein